MCCLLYFFFPMMMFPYTRISLKRKNCRGFGLLRHIFVRTPSPTSTRPGIRSCSPELPKQLSTICIRRAFASLLTAIQSLLLAWEKPLQDEHFVNIFALRFALHKSTNSIEPENRFLYSSCSLNLCKLVEKNDELDDFEVARCQIRCGWYSFNRAGSLITLRRRFVGNPT